MPFFPTCLRCLKPIEDAHGYVLNCSHIFCESCAFVPPEKCPLCSEACDAVSLQHLPSEVAAVLQSPVRVLKQAIESIEFQENHKAHVRGCFDEQASRHVLKLTEANRLLSAERSENSKLKAQLAAQEKEIFHLRSRLGTTSAASSRGGRTTSSLVSSTSSFFRPSSTSSNYAQESVGTPQNRHISSTGGTSRPTENRQSWSSSPLHSAHSANGYGPSPMRSPREDAPPRQYQHQSQQFYHQVAARPLLGENPSPHQRSSMPYHSHERQYQQHQSQQNAASTPRKQSSTPKQESHPPPTPMAKQPPHQGYTAHTARSIIPASPQLGESYKALLSGAPSPAHMYSTPHRNTASGHATPIASGGSRNAQATPTHKTSQAGKENPSTHSDAPRTPSGAPKSSPSVRAPFVAYPQSSSRKRSHHVTGSETPINRPLDGKIARQ